AARAGGVQRYLSAKRAWLRRHGVRHTILAPGAADGDPHPGIATLRVRSRVRPYGFPFPLRAGAWRRALVGLAPDLIEAGDPFAPAWAALRAGHELGVPAVAFYHSDLVRLVSTRLGPAAEWAATRYVCELYRGFDLVFAPSRYVATRLVDLGIERV